MFEHRQKRRAARLRHSLVIHLGSLAQTFPRTAGWRFLGKSPKILSVRNRVEDHNQVGGQDDQSMGYRRSRGRVYHL